jgi:hypothetical protein
MKDQLIPSQVYIIGNSWILAKEIEKTGFHLF